MTSSEEISRIPRFLLFDFFVEFIELDKELITSLV